MRPATLGSTGRVIPAQFGATIPGQETTILNLTGRGLVMTCDGITRRDFLQAGTLGALGLTLAKFNALPALAAEQGKPAGDDGTTKPEEPAQRNKGFSKAC